MTLIKFLNVKRWSSRVVGFLMKLWNFHRVHWEAEATRKSWDKQRSSGRRSNQSDNLCSSWPSIKYSGNQIFLRWKKYIILFNYLEGNVILINMRSGKPNTYRIVTNKSAMQFNRNIAFLKKMKGANASNIYCFWKCVRLSRIRFKLVFENEHVVNIL